MKKFLACVLSMVMLLSMVTFASAKVFNDVDGQNEVAIETLSDLGIIKGYDDGTFGPNNAVTRAEMAALVVRALGYEDLVNVSSQTKFSDVASDSWYAGYVALASSLNIIEGYGDGKFGPTDSVTYDQMVTMVVRALGYGKDINGGYPNGYIYKALELKIMEDVKVGTAPAMRRIIAQMLYNSLTCDIATVSYNKLFDMYVTDKNTGDTMLKRLGATVTKGVVEYSDAMNMGRISDVGVYSEMYKNSKGKVIATAAIDEVVTGEFAKDNKVKVGSTVYTIKTGAIDSNTKYFLNAKSVSAYSLTIGNTYKFSCVVDGNYITDVYAVNAWVGTSTFQLTKSNVSNLAKAALSGYNFETTSKDEVDYNSFELNGVKNLSDLMVNDVVTVYTYGNSGKTIVRLDVAANVISGTVTKIRTSSEGVEYTINGIAYKLADGVSALTAGTEYKCYLNAAGKIFKVERIKSATQNYGVYYAKEASTTFNNAKIGLYLKDNTDTVTVLSVADSVDLSKLTVGSLVTYTVNKNGLVNDITVANKSTNTNIYNSVMKADGSYYRLADDAVVFTVDTDSDVNVSSVAKLTKNTNIGNTYFVLDSDDTVLAMLVNATYADAETSTGYCVVNEISSVATEKATVSAVSGYIDGVKVVDKLGTSNNLVANSIGLYKIGYSGDEIKSLNLVTPSKTTGKITDIDDEFIYDGSEWFVLDDDVVIYEYDADDGYSLVNQISYGTHAYLYDTSSKADGVYDVVICFDVK